MPEPDHVHELARLLDGESFAMLTTRSEDGTLMSRPMALQEVEFDGDLWFFTARDSRKAAHVGAEPQVNVTVSSRSVWVSLTGSAAVVEDPSKKTELWNAGIEAWFPGGRDSDKIVLLRVEGESAEYWDTPGGQVTTAVSYVKAKLTGKRYTGGEDHKLDLA